MSDASTAPNPNRAAARLEWARAAFDDPTLQLEPASADASFRSYWRARQGGESWIVMDSPPALEDPRPWLAIDERLHAAGLHVPAVHAHDLRQGFLLIEDLGAQLYLPALNDDSAEALYGDAMTALLRMQTAVEAGDLPPYDAGFLRRELELMPTWFLDRHLDRAPDAAARETLDAAFDAIVASALEQPRCFVHRDFHSRNLLVLDSSPAPCRSPLAGDAPALISPEEIKERASPASGLLQRPGVVRVPGFTQEPGIIPAPGIIDFQGALCGPLTYDLASLLRDCYIAWEDARVYTWVEGYRRDLQRAGLIGVETDSAQFRRWFDLIGLQRHLKVLGIFCRLWYRDGKRHYLDDLPLVFRYVIDVARRYPELAPLAALLERSLGERDLTAPTA